jgi:hypothetical protein
MRNCPCSLPSIEQSKRDVILYQKSACISSHRNMSERQYPVSLLLAQKWKDTGCSIPPPQKKFYVYEET